MKMKCLTFILCAFATLAACGDPATKNKRLQNTVEEMQLALTDILDIQKINQFLNHSTANSKASSTLFLKGMDASKNKKLIDSARFYLERSIQQFPTANAYFELGSIYKTKKEYDKALKSYQLAERLEYSPFATILYETATIHALKKEPELAAKTLEIALQAGFSDFSRLNEDKSLSELRDSNNYLFLESIKKGSRGMSNPEILMWTQFKRKFDIPKYPLRISSEMDYEAIDAMGYISYEFEKFVPEMRNAMFTRDVSQTYHYAYNLGENEQFTALLYVENLHYVGDFLPKIFTIVTFNAKGKQIDRLHLKNMELQEDEMVAIDLKKPLQLVANVYKLEFEKPKIEEGLWDNKISARHAIATYAISFDSHGKIIKTKAQSNVMANN